MRWADLAVIILYLSAITWFGVRFQKSQRTLKDYFLGGKTTPWWAISLSIVSAETSTLTIIGTPVLAFQGDYGFLQLVLGYLLARSAFTELKKRVDYSEYGGAPLLGVKGCTIICHGRSNANAIRVHFRDGTATPRLEVEFPVGHPRRRREGRGTSWRALRGGSGVWQPPVEKLTISFWDPF